MAKTLFTLGALAVTLLPSVTFAQLNIPTPEPADIQRAEDLIGVLNRVADIIFVVMIILAVIFILFAAFYYLTAAGDPAKVTTANNRLIYAAVAIAVALLAQAAVTIVSNFLQR